MSGPDPARQGSRVWWQAKWDKAEHIRRHGICLEVYRLYRDVKPENMRACACYPRRYTAAFKRDPTYTPGPYTLHPKLRPQEK